MSNTFRLNFTFYGHDKVDLGIMELTQEAQSFWARHNNIQHYYLNTEIGILEVRHKDNMWELRNIKDDTLFFSTLVLDNQVAQHTIMLGLGKLQVIGKTPAHKVIYG